MTKKSEIQEIKNSSQVLLFAKFWKIFNAKSKKDFIDFLNEQIAKGRQIFALDGLSLSFRKKDENQPLCFAVLEFDKNFYGEIEARIQNFCAKNLESDFEELEKEDECLKILISYCIDYARNRDAIRLCCNIITANSSLHRFFASQRFTINSFGFLKNL